MTNSLLCVSLIMWVCLCPAHGQYGYTQTFEVSTQQDVSTGDISEFISDSEIEISDLSKKTVGGLFDVLIEEDYGKEIPLGESTYTVSDFEKDADMEKSYGLDASARGYKVYVERESPQASTLQMQMKQYTDKMNISKSDDSNKMNATLTNSKKIVSNVDLETVPLKDARYCDGHLVQNNQISWSLETVCPSNMMKKPLSLKIKCSNFHACTVEDCCVAKCTTDVCTNSRKPYAKYETVCSSLQGETLSDPSKCSASQCCTDKPEHCEEYLRVNNCPSDTVTLSSQELFDASVTDYQGACCPHVSTCKIFGEKYGCPTSMQLKALPESTMCFGTSEDTCDFEDCCEFIPEPDYDKDWTYYQNNGESDDVEEPYYHAEFVGHFLYEADELLMFNVTPGNVGDIRIENCRAACAYQNPNGIEGSQWSTFGQATGFVLVNKEKCICQKISEHAAFSVPPITQRFAYTNQLDVVEHLVKYKSAMFETFTLAPVRVHDYSFDSIFLNSFGKCRAALYLPGHSGMAPKLASSDPLYDADGKTECLHRCVGAYPDSRGFFISHSDQSCACAQNNCNLIDSHNDFRPYEIQPIRVAPTCRFYPVPRNDIPKPEHAVYCKSCTDAGPDSVCLEWVYITPESQTSTFDVQESRSCDEHVFSNATCTKCKNNTCLDISCAPGVSNENGLIEDGCESVCIDNCEICDNHNASLCVRDTCDLGSRPTSEYITVSDPQGSCEACPTGQYGDGKTCHDCSEGKYQNEDGQQQCKQCAVGRYGTRPGTKSPCKACPQKTITESTGSSSLDECVACPSGHEVRNQVCTQCEAGKFEVDAQCLLCEYGTTSEPGASRGCMACSPGKSLHNGECISCPPGRFKGGDEENCVACPQGWFQAESMATECQECPQNTLSLYDAATTCYCIGETQNCTSPIQLLSKEKVLEKVHTLLYQNTDLIQTFLDILGTKCLEDIERKHENCNECSNPFGSKLKCLQTSSGPVQDTDNDGYMDYVDAFPKDPTEWKDTDGDGVGDNKDTYPNDPSRWSDTDGDGVDDLDDRFPNNPNEWQDTDNDNVGDNADAFPNDPAESRDDDNDGVGNNEDKFDNDPTEWDDDDNDGLGDNEDDPYLNDSDNDGFTNLIDAFPLDPTEWSDTDNDGVGDQQDDPFPNDTDNDGTPNPNDFDAHDASNNAGKTWHNQAGVDHFPNDPNEQTDTDGDGTGDNADTDDDDDGRADPTITVVTSGTCASHGKVSVTSQQLCEYALNTAAPGHVNAIWSNSFATAANNPNCFVSSGKVYWNTNANPTTSCSSAASCVCVNSGTDLFPLNPTEWADLDGDGIGDNSDTDVDGDGHAQGANYFTSGTCADRNMFQIRTKKDCETAAVSLGKAVWTQTAAPLYESKDFTALGFNRPTCFMWNNRIYHNTNANPYPTGTSTIKIVCTTSDAFPNDPNEHADMDHDGIGDNSDTDKDGDGRVNSLNLLPAICTTMKDMTGPNSNLGRKGCDSARWSSGSWSQSYCRAVGTDGAGMSQNLKDFFTSCCDWTDGKCVSKVDAFPNDSTESTDIDGDGIGDNSDTDIDGDGVTNGVDAFPTNFYESSDLDGDGTGDNSDRDKDGDGVEDVSSVTGHTAYKIFWSVTQNCEDIGGKSITDVGECDAAWYQGMGKTPTNPKPGYDSIISTSSWGATTPPCMLWGSWGYHNTNSDPASYVCSHPSYTDGTRQDLGACLCKFDAFPNDPNEDADADGDGIGDNSDSDIDGDGVANVGYFLISSGTCASHNGVQVTEQADCQAARDELGLPNLYTGSYTPGTRPNCFVYTHLPDRVFYNTNTGSTDTPVPSSTWTAQVVCKSSVVDAFPFIHKESTDLDGDGMGDNTDEDIDGDGFNEHKYVIFTGDGTSSCASHGAQPITTAAECEQAADIYQGKYWQASSPWTQGTEGNPYCLSWGNGVYFNTHATVKDACGQTNRPNNAHYGACICKWPAVPDAFPNDATRGPDTDGDGTADWRIVNGEKVIEDWMPTDASGTQDSDMDGVADSADTYPNDPRRKIDVRAGLTPVSYSYDVASNSGTSTQSVAADTGYFLISSGTCASHGGVQVTEQADCQTARDELGLPNLYTGSYTPGTRPNCFVYTHLPDRVFYNTNTGSTDTPVPSSTWTAQVVCKKVGLSYTPQHMAAQVFEASLTANVDGYVAELVGDKACNYAESAVVKPTVPLNTGTRAQQVTNCKNACADTTQWGTVKDPEGMPEYELAYVDGYPKNYQVRSDGSTGSIMPVAGPIIGEWEELVSDCAKRCFHYANPPSKIKGFFVHNAHTSYVGRCYCTFKHSLETGKVGAAYTTYDFKTDTDLMNSEDKIRGFFLHDGTGNAALKGQCVCIKQDPYKNVESGHECLSQYDTYAIRGEECEKTSRPEYESVWEEVTGYCSSARSSGAIGSINFEACEKLCFEDETCLSFSYERDGSSVCRLPPPNYKCTGSNLLVNTVPWKTYNKRSAANQRFLSDNIPPVCLAFTCDGTSSSSCNNECCDWTGSACVNKWDNRFYDASTQKYNRVKSNSKCRRVFKWTKPHGDDAMCYDEGSSLRVYAADSNGCPAGDRECHVVKCAAKCFSGEYGASGTADLLRYGDNGFNDIMKGFGVDHKNGICECTTYGQMPCGSELEDGSSTELATDSFTATLYKKDHHCANYDDYYNVGEDYAKAVESCKEICGHEGEKGFFIHQTHSTYLPAYACACSSDTCVSTKPSSCCDSYHIDEKKLTGYEFMYECPEDDTKKVTNSKLLENRGRCTNKAEIYNTNSLGTCNEVQAGSCESKAYECAKTCAAYHWVETNKLQSNTNGVTFYSDLYVVPWETSCPIGDICVRMKGRILPGAAWSFTSSVISPMRVSEDEYVFGAAAGSYFKMVSVKFGRQTREFVLSESRYLSSSTVSSLTELTPFQWRVATKQGGGGTCGTNQYCAGDFYVTNENRCTCRQRVAGSSLTCTNNNDVNALTVKTHMTKTVADSQSINAEYNALTLTESAFATGKTCRKDSKTISYELTHANYRCSHYARPAGPYSSGYANFLDASHPMADTDRAQECANRCGAEGRTNFYLLKSSGGRCMCGTDTCSAKTPWASADLYRLIIHGHRNGLRMQPQRYKSLTMYLKHADYDASNGNCNSNTECEKTQCAKQCYSGEFGPFGQNPVHSDPRISTLYTKVYSGGYVSNYHKYYESSSLKTAPYAEFRIYAGCGVTDGPTNMYPDGTSVCEASPEKRIDECVAACYTYVWGGLKMQGFFAQKSTGRCYCSIPRGEATQYTPKPVFTTSALYDHYDFNRIYGELQKGWPNGASPYGSWRGDDWRIFEGSASETYPDGTTLGSATMEQKIEECARGCFAQHRLPSIQGSFTNYYSGYIPTTAKAFLVTPTDGRCYCSYVGNQRGTTTQTNNWGYYMGNFIRDTLPNFGRGKMKAIEYNSNSGECSCKSENSAQCNAEIVGVDTPTYVHMGWGICNDPLGVRMYEGDSDNPGTDVDSSTKECAIACHLQKEPLAYGPWASQGPAVGFSIVNGRCYCNHQTFASCSIKGWTDYKNYDFTSPVEKSISSTTWYDINFQSKKLGSKHLKQSQIEITN